MLKTISLFAILFTTFSVSLPAQSPKIDWGDEFKETRTAGLLNYIGYYDGHHYVLKGSYAKSTYQSRTSSLSLGTLRETSNASIVRLDEKMNPVKEQALMIQEDGRKLVPLVSFFLNDQLYLFSSQREGFDKEKHIFLQSVDKVTLQPQPDLFKVTTIPTLDRRYTGEVHFTFSQDSSHLMVFSNIQNRGRAPEKYAFIVYDDNMELQWSKEISLPVKNRNFRISDFLVDNDGNAYLVGKRYFNRQRERVQGKPNFEYVVTAYRDKGDSEAEYILNLKEHFLSDLKLNIAPNGDLVCAGFYSDWGVEYAKGTFYFKIDAATKGIKHTSLYEFSIDFLTQNLNDREADRLQRRVVKDRYVGLANYDIRDLVQLPDGSTAMIAEQFFVREVNDSADPTNVISQTEFHYNDIIVIDINPEGNIQWATKIPKRQTSTEDGGYYSSYIPVIRNDKLQFIYNDHRDNLDQEMSRNLRNFRLNGRKKMVVLATVDGNGNVTKSALIQGKDLETIIRPKMSTQTKDNELLIYGKRGRKTQFGRVEF